MGWDVVAETHVGIVVTQDDLDWWDEYQEDYKAKTLQERFRLFLEKEFPKWTFYERGSNNDKDGFEEGPFFFISCFFADTSMCAGLPDIARCSYDVEDFNTLTQLEPDAGRLELLTSLQIDPDATPLRIITLIRDD